MNRRTPDNAATQCRTTSEAALLDGVAEVAVESPSSSHDGGLTIMQFQPSFWLQFGRLCAHHLGKEYPQRVQIEGLIGQIAKSTLREQHAMVAHLLSALGQSSNATELAFKVGKGIPVTAHGVMCLGILTAPTIRDALRFLVEVHHVELPLINLSFRETASEGRLTIGFRCPIDNAGEALLVAACVAAVDREISRQSGRSGSFARLELTPSSNAIKASYRKNLSLTPHTDGASNQLVFSRATLDVSTLHADADTFKSLVHAYKQKAELHGSSADLSHRVREAIMSAISSPPSQKRLAKILDLTPRQLRARLDRENTSYQAMLRECRTEYTATLLRNPAISLSQIADRLGYSDLSAFSHAFHRWTGKNPSAFKTEIDLRR